MKRAVGLAVSVLMTLSGCALKPLYAGGSGGEVATGLARIAVAPIPDRNGWLLRNALIDRLHAPASGAAYRLEVTLDDDITGFGIRGDSAVTRERRTIRARYRLIANATGETLLDQTAGADAGIDVVSSEYATVAAEQSAAERLATLLADQIVARLGLYMARQGKAPTAAP
jgi:LPS-assembly lipoprotein